jgi:hypothetical protein
MRRAALVCLGWIALAPPPCASAEWVVSGYLGAGHTASSGVRLDQPSLATALTFDAVDFRGESFTPPLYYGYRIGYFFESRPWLGLEAEFIHLKVYAETDRVVRLHGLHRGVPVDDRRRLDDIVQQLSISHGLNFVLANAVARVPVGAVGGQRVAAVARLGTGPTVPHAESRIEGAAAREEYRLGAMGWQATAGLEALIGAHATVSLEYKLTRSRQRIDVVGGESGLTARSHHLVFGLGWRF